jgi:hypothetical protein
MTMPVHGQVAVGALDAFERDGAASRRTAPTLPAAEVAS